MFGICRRLFGYVRGVGYDRHLSLATSGWLDFI
jgi:hypothetical protein